MIQNIFIAVLDQTEQTSEVFVDIIGSRFICMFELNENFFTMHIF